jgi:hypothetical protein
MTDITTLQKAARVSTDENGEPVIQIPLALWDEFKAGFQEPEPQQSSQAERILAVIDSWDKESDKMSPVTFPVPDLDLGEEQGSK